MRWQGSHTVLDGNMIVGSQCRKQQDHIQPTYDATCYSLKQTDMQLDAKTYWRPKYSNKDKLRMEMKTETPFLKHGTGKNNEWYAYK